MKNEINPEKGTILCAETGIYYSPEKWISPKDAFDRCSWTRIDEKIQRELINRYSKHIIPTYVGEFVELEEWAAEYK